MTKADVGDIVSVHYEGKLEDGSVFNSSADGEPLRFQIGNGQLLPGFEDQVTGLKVGDEKEFTLTPEEAYGEHQPAAVIELPRERIPADIELKPGVQLTITVDTGEKLNLIVTAVRSDSVTLDGNHPLAGRSLTFQIKLVDILKAA